MTYTKYASFTSKWVIYSGLQKGNIFSPLKCMEYVYFIWILGNSYYFFIKIKTFFLLFVCLLYYLKFSKFYLEQYFDVASCLWHSKMSFWQGYHDKTKTTYAHYSHTLIIIRLSNWKRQYFVFCSNSFLEIRTRRNNATILWIIFQ